MEKLEKILWNLGGVLLTLANILCLLFFLLDNPWLIAMIAILVFDYIYIEKRPNWIEV
jgi:hypothetical protein